MRVPERQDAMYPRTNEPRRRDELKRRRVHARDAHAPKVAWAKRPRVTVDPQPALREVRPEIPTWTLVGLMSTTVVAGPEPVVTLNALAVSVGGSSTW